MHRSLLVSASLFATLSAQSPLTTLYAGGNGLGTGSTIYFDVVLNAPLTFGQFDVNSSSPAGTAGTLDVRWTSGTYVGNDTNAAAWTLGGSGPVTAAGGGLPSPCTLTPFTLPSGNYGIAITFNGIGQNYTNGTGTATPGSGTNQTWSTAEMTLLAGASAGGAPGTAICCYPRVFNGSIYYSLGGSGTVAQRNYYGAGCYLRLSSIYESFATSAAFDLANASVSWLPVGSDYVVIAGLGTYVPPSATAAVLSLTDDSQTAVTLSAAFPYPGGTTTSLTVCSNGYVSVASGNGTTYTPVVATMLNAPQTGWWNWHDYNPTLTSGGRVKFEEVGGVSIVTWDGVWDFGGTTVANANTFQFQFEQATGVVHLVMQTMSALGNPRLVGYSPGGPSVDPGNLDLSTVLATGITLTANDTQPLSLAASARPIIGTQVDLTTGNVVGNNLGVLFFGVVPIPAPGFDLGSIGAPGCPALVDVGLAVGNLIGNLPGTSPTVPLPIPNNNALIGGMFHAQSIWIDPTANIAGLITSNGLELVLGNF